MKPSAGGFSTAGHTGGVLTADIGTSSIKGGIISPDGRLLSWAREPLEAGDYLSYNPERWFTAFRSLLVSLAEIDPAAARSICAVSISGNGPTIVPLDERGSPSGPVLFWLDKREAKQPGTSSFFLPKISWIEKNRKDVHDRTQVYLGCPEYLSFRLTGVPTAVTPSGEFDPVYWDDDQIRLYGLDRNQLPDIFRVGTIVGGVTGEASSLTGLPEGIPVAAAGSDFLMSLLGTGAIVPGRTCDRAGTSEGINYCSNHPVSSLRIRCLPHVIEGYYNAAGILNSTGMIFEWFRALTGQRTRSYERFLKEIANVGHDARIPWFFPSLHLGAVWEFSGGVFAGLEADQGAPEMGRAVIKSIGFGIRDLIETLELNGCVIKSLRVSGGQGRSSIWNQMKADITGKSVEVPEVIDTELVGNACAAYTALGRFHTLSEASEKLVRIVSVKEPVMEEHRRFTESYRAYQDLCGSMIEVMGSIESLRHPGEFRQLT